MAQVTGRAKIAVNGKTYQSKEGAKLDPGGVTRDTVMSDQGGNHASKLRPSKVTCEFLWVKGLDVVALNDLVDVTIIFECDTNDTYVIEKAWRTGEMEATSGSSGGIPMTFEGPQATAVTGGA